MISRPGSPQNPKIFGFSLLYIILFLFYISFYCFCAKVVGDARKCRRMGRIGERGGIRERPGLMHAHSSMTPIVLPMDFLAGSDLRFADCPETVPQLLFGDFADAAATRKMGCEGDPGRG
jgi:hypothetical protein